MIEKCAHRCTTTWEKSSQMLDRGTEVKPLIKKPSGIVCTNSFHNNIHLFKIRCYVCLRLYPEYDQALNNLANLVKVNQTSLPISYLKIPFMLPK